MKSTKSKVQKANTNFVDNYIARLLLLLVGFLPLIVRIKTHDYVSPTIDYSEVFNSGFKGDFFEYNKLAFLKLIVVLMIILFLYKTLKSRYTIPLRIEYIGLALIFVLILFSGVFSEYPTIAFNGIHERHEGTYAYLGYILVCFIAANLKYEDRHLRYFNYALLLVMCVNLVTSVTHFFGYDLFKYYAVKRLITPLGFGVDIISPKSFFITTLANQNYLSGLAGAATGYFLIRSFLSVSGKENGINLLGSLISFICILTSTSSSGFVTFLVALPIILIAAFFNDAKRNNLKRYLVYLVSYILSLSLVFIMLNNYNPLIYRETLGVFNGNTVQQINLQENQKVYNITPKGIELPKPGISPLGGRLFLWQESLKLIAEKPFLGHGADTIYYYFPNNSMAVYQNTGTTQGVVTKAHNFYVNTAFNFGIPVLIIMLLTIGCVFIRISLLLIKRGISNSTGINMLAFLVLLAGLLIQWIVNDSVIGVAVIFWSILGISIALYYQTIEN